MTYLRLLRPRQWLKNLILYFPPLLAGSTASASITLLDPSPFVAFCLVSSGSYILNDIIDIERDRVHPTKQFRPLASGTVPVSGALLLCGVLASAGFFFAYTVTSRFILLLALYALISLSYSLTLKNFVIIDIFCISAGFVLRLFAGGEAFSILISDWLFLSVFLLSIFLSTGKRLHEKKLLGKDAFSHRTTLLSYPEGFLEGTMYMTGAAVLVTYTMYVLSRPSPVLLYSVPLCCFGLLRYILRVFKGEGGDPTDSLTRDPVLFCVGLLWVLVITCGIYGRF